MTDSRQRQPVGDEAPHTIPRNAASLAATRKRTMPERAHSEPKNRQRRLIHGYSVVADVTTDNRVQPLALCGDGFVHPSLKFGFHLVQFRLQPLAYRLPQHRIPSIAFLLHADMRKAEKVERFWFPFSTPPPLVDCERTKFQQPRLLGMQFQVKLPHSFREFRPKLIGIRFLLESQHDIVSKAHDDHIPVSMLPSPCLDPQVEYVMNVGSPGSRARCLRTCSGSLTARDSGTPRDIGAPDGAFRFLLQRRRPGVVCLRGSIPGPHVPLSTLRRRPCEQLRMTRGRCGSLLHIRMTFAFTTPRRFTRRTGEQS
jgi:hypothetical protein